MSATTIERGRFAHFLSAQDDGTFERALGEIRRGAKTTHWMWFIFPQIAGLGSSANARKFALASAAEAAQFAAHDELGPRLFEATEALLDWAGTLSAQDILGPVDTVKLRSLGESTALANQLKTLLEAHLVATGSPRAGEILAHWDEQQSRFIALVPPAEEEGLGLSLPPVQADAATADVPVRA